MAISNEQKLKSIGNINKFINHFKEIRNIGVLCKINYLKTGKGYLTDTCTCHVFYNHGYPQIEFQIDWNYEKCILRKHKLRETYNTNFHIFHLEDNILKIVDKSNIITVEVEENYDENTKENEAD